ncbi:MATE family efflux transporter [bacterium]|nr:MATE family efflux transporter [bacterium]
MKQDSATHEDAQPRGKRSAEDLRGLLLLSYPLVISFCVRSLFTFVDTIYASFLSDDAIAAIGLAIPFEFVMIAIWVGISSGLTSYLSKGILSTDGEDEYEIYLKSARRMVYFAIGIFVLFGLSIFLFAPLLDLEQGVVENFQIYGAVLIIGSACTSFWSIIPDSIVKAHHDTRSTMIAGMLSNGVNIILNTIFLFVFHWGIFGIALSTVLGRLGGLSYGLYRARVLEEERRAELSPTLRVTEESSKSCSEASREILRIALPSASTYVLMSLETFVINFLMASLPDSTSALAAYGIYYRVVMFALMPIIATSVAVLPFVARLSQQKKIDAILESYRGILRLSIGYALIAILPICLLGAEWIVAALTDTQTMQDYGEFGILLVPFVCAASAPFLLSKPVLEGFQRGGPVLKLALLRYVVFTFPLCGLGRYLAPEFGLNGFRGVMIGLFIANLLTAQIANRTTTSTIKNLKGV